MSARRSKRRKLAFEQLENKTSPTGAMVDVDYVDVLDSLSVHMQRQRTVEFLQFVAGSLGNVSISRELPAPSDVASADTMLAHESIPNH